LRKIRSGHRPLPLIQVNPPGIKKTSRLLKRVYTSGNFSNSGQIQREVSKTLALQVEDSFSGVLVNNNTMGLTAALLTIDVKGRHVLVSNFTFAATIQSILLAGGIPVVCDVDKSTLELNSDIAARMLSKGDYDFAAVVPTRVLGYVNDFSLLIQCCNSFEVPVVVDAAAAYPSKKNYWDFPVQATFEVFSFHATKVFGIGEGGLIVGQFGDIQKVNKTINFGFTSETKMEFHEGLNAKADEFTAARAKIRQLDYAKDVESRRKFASHYENFANSSNLLSCLTSNEKTVFAYFPIIFQNPNQLVRFKSALDPKITTRRYYFPTIFRGYRGISQVIFENNLDVSESIAPKILCLPVYCKYEKRLPKLVVRELNEALEAIS